RVLVPVQHRRTGPLLPDAIAAAVVLELELGVQRFRQAGEHDGARETVEAMSMSCADQAHGHCYHTFFEGSRKAFPINSAVPARNRGRPRRRFGRALVSAVSAWSAR